MLYIVGTPIGNIKDMSLRAIETLQSVDVIIAESVPDTRKLLQVLEISGKKVLKFNERNSEQAIAQVLEILGSGDAAFVTSAGMPGVSDPGADLLAACYEHEIDVEPIPGPSALSTAIAMSGFSAKRFTFVGFLPRKKGKVTKLLESFLVEDSLVVFFESPFRVIKSLEHIQTLYPEIQVFIGREMTKKFQTYKQGSINQIIEGLQENKDATKGEFTVVLKG